MQFPLTLAEMMLWLGVTAFLLLITSEALSPYYGQVNLLIDKKKLRVTALILSILFLLVAFVRIYEIFTY